MNSNGTNKYWYTQRVTFNTGPISMRVNDNTSTCTGLWLLAEAAVLTALVSESQTWWQSDTGELRYFVNAATGTTSFPAQTEFYMAGKMNADYTSPDVRWTGVLAY